MFSSFSKQYSFLVLAICAQGCEWGACTSPDQCTCLSGWSGVACDIPVCDPPCNTHAHCSQPNTCECVGQWRGANCGKNTNTHLLNRNLLYFCKHHEIFLDICAIDCGLHGTCDDSGETCICELGYSGPFCQQSTNIKNQPNIF